MLSVITHSRGSPEGVSGLFSDLVPGAVSGLIRDVILVESEGDGEDLAALCREAGASSLSGGLGVAVREARSHLILLASPQLRLDSFALERLGREVRALDPEAAGRGLALKGRAFLGIWSPGPPLGLVATRGRLLALAPGVGLETALRKASRGAQRLDIAGRARIMFR